MLRILYVHYVPTASGSAISLGLLLRQLDRSRFEPHVVQVHREDGPVRRHFADAGAICHHVPTPLVWDLPWWAGENLRSRGWRAFRSDASFENFLRALAPALVHVNDFPAIPAAIAA